MKFIDVSKYIAFFVISLFLLVISAGFFHLDSVILKELFMDQEFLHAVKFSLTTSFIATAIAFVLGVPSGYFLARKKGRLSRFLDTLFDIPLILPPLIIGTLLLMFLNLSFIRPLFSFIFTTTGAVIAQLFVAMPFTVKAAKNAFDLIPPVFERVAMTLGAKPLKSFYDTTFKIALPGILSGLVLTWLRCMGEFGATLLVAGGIPGKTANIPINIYLNMTAGDFDKGIVASIVIAILSFLSIFIIKAILTRQESA